MLGTLYVRALTFDSKLPKKLESLAYKENCLNKTVAENVMSYVKYVSWVGGTKVSKETDFEREEVKNTTKNWKMD